MYAENKINLTPVNLFFNERFTFLLVLLLFYMIAIPFFEGFIKIRIFMAISFSAVLLSAVYAVSQQQRHFIIAALLGLAAITTMWLSYFVESSFTVAAFRTFTILFESYMVITILNFIFGTPIVTGNVISAAIVVYLFVGSLWSHIFVILETLQPGSFSTPHDMLCENPAIFIYYSFVTLTTLGYGDITPLTTQARTLAITEAIIGQIYMTVLIARLVGLQIAQSSKKT